MIIDYNKFLNLNTLVWFADAVKCFDKLNLIDCCKEIWKLTNAKEAYIMYCLNKEGLCEVKTPYGITKKIDLVEIVMQGTSSGPTQCVVSTDKVNNIGKKYVTFIRNIEVLSCVFVDDIMHPSSNVENINGSIDNCRNLELMKGFTFSNKVEKTGVLEIGTKKCDSEITSQVEAGKIQKVEEYKYLGQWYNKKGNHEIHIRKVKEKINFFVTEVKRFGSTYQVGRMAIEIRIKLYKTVVFPSVFYAMETWSNVTQKDLEEVEKIQGEILKGLFELRISTPYWGVLAETGLWPVKEMLRLKRLMLCQNIVNSEDDRIVKQIVRDQFDDPYPKCWGQIILDDCEILNINKEFMWTKTKTEFKSIVKEKIKLKIIKDYDEVQKAMSKLRFVEKFERKDYITELYINECKLMMNLRLNMIEVKQNYKGQKFADYLCPCCRDSIDNTEHLLECICKYVFEPKVNINDLIELKNLNSILKRAKTLLEARENLGICII